MKVLKLPDHSFRYIAMTWTQTQAEKVQAVVGPLRAARILVGVAHTTRLEDFGCFRKLGGYLILGSL